MLVDTHCHFDAPFLHGQGAAVLARAQAAGVGAFVVPAVHVAGFAGVQALAWRTPGVGYALGIHPCWVAQSSDADLLTLRAALSAARDDPKLLAVGEIGLDHHVPGHDRARMAHFWLAQLQLAVEFGLPVIVHSRRAIDLVLAALRRYRPVGGIAHAFNGSAQQAEALIQCQMALGFGGVLTYPRALRIRRLARSLPLSACVLETDAPDMAPRGCPAGQNEPAHVAAVAQVWADLRGISVAQLAQETRATAQRVLTKLAGLIAASEGRGLGVAQRLWNGEFQ